MSEGFPRFDDLHKSLFASIIAFSSSGIASISFIIFNDKFDLFNKCLFNIYFFKIISSIGLIGFSFSIIIIIISAFISLYHFSKDGESSNCLSYREINKKAFKIIKYSLIFFIIGFISLITLLSCFIFKL
jgi:hypothetical protein